MALEDGWGILETNEGAFDVFERGFVVQYDLSTLDDALYEIEGHIPREQLKKGVEVTIVWNHGYEESRVI